MRYHFAAAAHHPRNREDSGVRVLTVAAEIQPCDVAFARARHAQRRMRADQRFELARRQQPARVFGGDQFVLAEEERVVRPQPLPFGPHVEPVGRQDGLHIVPADLVVEPDHVVRVAPGVFRPVAPDSLFEQRAAVPGGAEEQGRGVGGGGHRAELAIEPVRVHLLRLIGDDRERGCVPGHVGERRRAEKDRRGRAQPQRGFVQTVARVATGQQAGRHLHQLARALQADRRLRVEGGRTEDEAPALQCRAFQEHGDDRRGHFVLARLARKHHGER